MCKNGGHADHVLDLGFAKGDDLLIWRTATARESILVSKDEDFSRLASRLNENGCERACLGRKNFTSNAF